MLTSRSAKADTPVRSMNRSGFRGGSISRREDGAHGITEEVSTRAA